MRALFLSLLLHATAWATPLPADRPFVPSASVAGEAGPLQAWVNPALPGFDPDPRYGAVLAFDTLGRRSIGASAGMGGLSVGLANLVHAPGQERWVAHYASSAQLPGRLSFGTSVNWHLVGGSGNHLAIDAGLAWRPRSWIGFAGAVRSIGAPDPTGTIPTSGVVGAVIRPLDDALLIGLDGELYGGARPTRLARATVRARPVEGLYLRGYADTELSFGAGFEVYFGGAGGGVHASAGRHAPLGALMIGTDEPGESLAGLPPPVQVLDLRRDLPYTARDGLLSGPQPGWLDTLGRLKKARERGSARAVLLRLGGASISWARRQELRRELLALRAEGVPVIAWLDGSVGTGDVWVASAADRIIAHPAADIGLIGPTRKLTYLRGLFDRLGVRFEVVRRGDYKSAVEPLTRDSPSGPTLEQEGALLDDLHAQLVADLAEGRGESKGSVHRWLEGPWTAEEALDLKIVDALVWPDEVDDFVEAMLERTAPSRNLQRLPSPRSGWASQRQIAVIVVDGMIMPGASQPGLIGPRVTGGATIARMIRRAAEDPDVAAVVLRVDSPGGSLYASEEIWRATTQLREEGKPLVVSLGGVAASGGYFIATAADAIWAEPTTITGSIGIFLQKPDLSEGLAQLGLTFAELNRGGGARLDPTRPLTPIERARYEEIVGAGYTRFKDRVAQGRGLTDLEVEAAAGGRVWSGRDAHAGGLVDHLGGFNDAVADAKARAELSDKAQVRIVRAGSSPALDRLAPLIYDGVQTVRERGAKNELPEALKPLVHDLATWILVGSEGLWMLAPFDPEVR
ncbi:MAG: hypothetical protein EA397_06550 [Deltaproteobacteria bacterium]|nr:MAG: hypothetical protein EA397_06550 [Deltaproteobacteria bacterium]